MSTPRIRRPSNTPRVLAAAFVVALTAAASAQKVTPGLWENVITMKAPGGEMDSAMAQAQQQMAQLPPDQRKMVEQMMARQGVGAGASAGSRATTVRVCVTKEQAARDELLQGEGQCTQQITQRSGSTLKFRFSCTGDPPSSGEGEYTLVSDRAYTGRTVVNTQLQGKPERMEMQQSGKWLADDCGSVEPRK